ncbi:MAG: glycosyltransferase family 25 protein, partial [Gammaproteobacteria bacterium]
YELVDAVDGKTLDLSALGGRLRQDIARMRCSRDLTAPEIGCYLSHYNLWKKLAADKTECALILEDDAVWNGDLAPVIRSLQNAPCAWDIAVLHTDPKGYGGDVAWKISGTNYKLIRGNKRIVGGTAYLIKLNAAQKLSEYCYDIFAPVDNVFGEYWRNGLVFYAVQPRIADQDGESYIGPRVKSNFADKIRGKLWRNADRLRQKWYNFKNPVVEIPNNGGGE